MGKSPKKVHAVRRTGRRTVLRLKGKPAKPSLKSMVNHRLVGGHRLIILPPRLQTSPSLSGPVLPLCWSLRLRLLPRSLGPLLPWSLLALGLLALSLVGPLPALRCPGPASTRTTSMVRRLLLAKVTNSLVQLARWLLLLFAKARSPLTPPRGNGVGRIMARGSPGSGARPQALIFLPSSLGRPDLLLGSPHWRVLRIQPLAKLARALSV